MTYQELRDSLAIFGLGDRATLNQIKSRHRALAKAHHPDRNTGHDHEAIQRINAAYQVLLSYCVNYRYCFDEAEFLEQHPEERLRRQFGWDPVWSGNEE